MHIFLVPSRFMKGPYFWIGTKTGSLTDRHCQTWSTFIHYPRGIDSWIEMIRMSQDLHLQTLLNNLWMKLLILDHCVCKRVELQTKPTCWVNGSERRKCAMKWHIPEAWLDWQLTKKTTYENKGKFIQLKHYWDLTTQPNEPEKF